MNRIRWAAFCFSTLLVIPMTAYGLPRFASRLGVSCQTCHVNPTGGGMRTESGRTFARDDMTMPTFRGQTDFDDVPVKLTERFTIGGDFRTMYFYDRATRVGSFFQMQGALHFDFRLNKSVRVLFSRGLSEGSFELFAVGSFLPMEGYLKAGRFVPAYGTRTDDHTAFVRGGPRGNPTFMNLIPSGYPKGLPFGERAQDTGIEVGFAPRPFTLTASIVNGTPGATQPIGGSDNKALILRGDGRFSVGGVRVSLGGSAYTFPTTNGNDSYALFGALTLLDNVTLTSEVDFLQTIRPAGGMSRGIVFWHELNWMVSQGVDLKLGYESYDPDRDLQDGIFSQVTLGAELFLMSGVELRPIYRFAAATVPGQSPPNMDQALVLLHLYF